MESSPSGAVNSPSGLRAGTSRSARSASTQAQTHEQPPAQTQAPADAQTQPHALKVFDVEAAFRARNPALARLLPPGTFALLRAVLHEPLVNWGIHRYGAGDALTFCRKVLDHLNIRVELERGDRLRECPRPVVCANHPSGGIEGLVLIAEILQAHGRLSLPANELLGMIPALAPLIVPIDRYRGNRGVARRYADAFAADPPVLVFPAGRTARIRAGRLREYPWAKSFVTAARRHDRVVLPVWVSGRNSALFYGIHRARRALGVSLNVEMLLLVDELLRRRGDVVTVRFGAPRPARDLVESDPVLHRADRRVAFALQREVEQLGRVHANT